MSRSRTLPSDLARRLWDQDRGAVPEALNLTDDRRPEQRAAALALLDALESEAPSAGSPRIGFTGAPGAGKSTLIDAIVRALRERDQTVAVVAVDPSSRRSGGALLGDRIRMRSRRADPGVYIRSMAARDQLGGIADATRAGVTILAAAFDTVLVETVGVGQSESEITAIVDTLAFVANPGSGDALQFMKAGVLELPDIFVVNKSDIGKEAGRTAGELQSSLQLTERDSGGWRAPVLLASAQEGSGLDAVLAALDEHRAHLEQSDELGNRRAAGREAYVTQSLLRRYGTHGIERIGGIDAIIDRIRERDTNRSFAWVETLGREIEDILRKPI